MKIIHLIRRLFGYGFYAYSASGSVMKYSPNREDALGWLKCGLAGETVTILQWQGGCQWSFIASTTKGLHIEPDLVAANAKRLKAQRAHVNAANAQHKAFKPYVKLYSPT